MINRKVRNMLKNKLKNIVLHNVAKTNYHKKCLMVYIIKPFILKNKDIKHTNYYEATIMVRVIGSLGYNVDVIATNNTKFKNFDRYDLIIGLGDAYARSMGKCKADCKRIFYATGACFLDAFNNETKRWINLYRRDGICYAMPRFALPENPEKVIQSIMSSDAIITVGGKWCSETYMKFEVPVYSIGAIGFSNVQYEGIKRDIGKARKNYLWLGGYGLVHKGLDICLKAFAELNDFDLYIACEYEKGFFEKYSKELELNNIHYAGFIDINSDKFTKLCEKCAFIIMNSSSEATCTSVLTVMNAGLIPVTNRECDIDFGIRLSTDTPAEMVEVIRKIDKEYTNEKIEHLMKDSYEYVKMNYTCSNYENNLQKSISDILKKTQ